MFRRLTLALIAVFVAGTIALLIIGRCTREDIPGVTRPLTLQLQWFDQAQFIGFYVAAENGYYADEGIDVEIVPGGYTVNPVDRVLQGSADIGIATGDQLVISRARNAELRAIGTVFRQSLAAFMSKEEDDIRTTSDLVGKTVGVYPGFDTENILLSMLARAGINPSEVNIVAAGPLEAFVQGDLDVFPAYLLNEPIQMRQQNIPIRLLLPDSAGIHYYSDTIFTKSTTLGLHRDIVRRFLRASSRGWQFAKDSPEEALDLMYKRASNLDRENRIHQKQMLEAEVPYLGDGPQRRVFFMDRARWQSMEQHLFEIGKISSRGNIDNLVDFEIVEESE